MLFWSFLLLVISLQLNGERFGCSVSGGLLPGACYAHFPFILYKSYLEWWTVLWPVYGWYSLKESTLGRMPRLLGWDDSMMLDLMGTVNCMDLAILLITVLTPDVIGLCCISSLAEDLVLELFCLELLGLKFIFYVINNYIFSI